MKARNLKPVLILILCICLFGCAFEENREVEKKLTNGVNNFHALFNQEKFYQIYAEADEELKNKFTEQQFVSYLDVVKANDVNELKQSAGVWIKDDLSDGIKRAFFRKTRFSNVELVFSDKSMFREKFEWNLKSGEPKLSAYVMEKVCDKPCRININTK